MFNKSGCRQMFGLISQNLNNEPHFPSFEFEGSALPHRCFQLLWLIRPLNRYFYLSYHQHIPCAPTTAGRCMWDSVKTVWLIDVFLIFFWTTVELYGSEEEEISDFDIHTQYLLANFTLIHKCQPHGGARGKGRRIHPLGYINVCTKLVDQHPFLEPRR